MLTAPGTGRAIRPPLFSPGGGRAPNSGARSPLATTLEKHRAKVEELHQAVHEVAELQKLTRSGEGTARQKLATAGPRRQETGRAVVRGPYSEAHEGGVTVLQYAFLHIAYLSIAPTLPLQNHEVAEIS